MMERAIKEMRISELRALQEEKDEMMIEGYAAVFEQETDLGWCKEVIDRNGSALVVSHYARFYQMIKPTHVHVIVDGKILLTGDETIVEKIDKQGFDWVKAEYGIDVNKVDLRPSSIGLCGVKESLKNAK